MNEESEAYCTGKDFQVVFIAGLSNFRLWQCKKCAYQFSQPLTDIGEPSIPDSHPKPASIHIVVSDEQKAWLKALLRMHDEAEKHGNARDFTDFLDFFTKE